MLHTGYVTYADEAAFLSEVKIRIPDRFIHLTVLQTGTFFMLRMNI